MMRFHSSRNIRPYAVLCSISNTDIKSMLSPLFTNEHKLLQTASHCKQSITANDWKLSNINMRLCLQLEGLSGRASSWKLYLSGLIWSLPRASGQWICQPPASSIWFSVNFTISMSIYELLSLTNSLSKPLKQIKLHQWRMKLNLTVPLRNSSIVSLWEIVLMVLRRWQGDSDGLCLRCDGSKSPSGFELGYEAEEKLRKVLQFSCVRKLKQHTKQI